jgi:hypothetical protein
VRDAPAPGGVPKSQSGSALAHLERIKGAGGGGMYGSDVGTTSIPCAPRNTCVMLFNMTIADANDSSPDEILKVLYHDAVPSSQVS